MFSTQISTKISSNRRAQGLAEYIILVVLIAITVVGLVQMFGGTIHAKYDTANTAVQNMEGGSKAPSTVYP